jgi:uncharacterized cupredoxin-like copper-binding protein
MRPHVGTILVLLTILACASGVTAIACGDDDDGGVEVIGGPSAEADPEPDPDADPDPEPDPEADHDAEAAAITPAPKPDAAEQLNVTLSEWGIATSAASVPAGNVYFLVENAGPEDAHEFVVIRTDLASDALPVEDGRVPEDEVDLLAEIEPFAAGSTGSLTVDLEPGSYVLICNITHEEHGELESHYELGMHAPLVVE